MIIVKYLSRGILILIGSLLVIPMLIITVIAAASVKYITFIEAENDRLNRVNANSVSKMELDTCRSLNKALREDNVRLRKELKRFKGLAAKRNK